MNDNRDRTTSARIERLALAASVTFLVATLVWFFFWVDPDRRGRLAWWDAPAGANSNGNLVGDSQEFESRQPTSSAGPGAVEDSEHHAESAAAASGTAVHFVTGQACALCHAESTAAQAMRDAAGRSVAPFDQWQASMMAQSARDPYWRAVLSAEVAATPNQKSHIEEVCTRCHAPMAAPVELSPPGQVLAFLQPTGPRASLGLDGVSCTVCHQMTDQGFGTDASFTGHFELNTQSLIFGPHEEPFPMPMQRHVDYTPAYGPHVLQSALCATCHTVITEAVTPDGEPTKTAFHEQTPYLEWRNSVFNNEVADPAPMARSCQSCHMPTIDSDGQPISTTLAHNPGGRDFPFLEPRQPYGQHTLVGGNAFMTRLLRDNAAELGISVPRSAFDRSLAAIQRLLQEQTATVEIGPLETVGDRGRLSITVRNLCGHKFPTAYPSRRAWIRLNIWTAENHLVFTSGAFDSRGQLLDAAGQVLASELAAGPVQPHWQRIDSGDQVQIYETVMGNTDGQPTFYLLHGAKFLKDNRLLPLGWRLDHPDGPATAPAGVAADEDFHAGVDIVTYDFPLSTSEAYRVEASLFFQSISPRHAAELFTNETAEVTTFRRLYAAADHEPELIGRHEVIRSK